MTAGPVLLAPAPGPRRPSGARRVADVRESAADLRRETAQVRLITALVLCVVLLQRLVLPLGGDDKVPLLLPLALLIAGGALAAGTVRIDTVRAGLVLLALGVCVTSGVLALASGQPASVLSVLYLIASYAPFILVLDRPGPRLLDRCLDRLAVIATAAAVVAIVQTVIQPLGVPYSDLFRYVVPSVLLQDGFNTSYPIVYGASLYKANAWVFLEPSFCSQFLGLALVVLLARRRRDWRLLVIAGGILCTVAGTGMAVVVVGCAVLLAQQGLRSVLPLLPPAVVATAVASVTPLGTVLASRLTETGESGSSGSLRFVQPFEVVGGAWLSDVSTALLGAGPGASERLAVQVAGSTALQQPVPLKLLYDYGVVAAVVFLACMLWVFVSRGPVPALTGALLASWLILNSALLLPVVVVMLWIFTTLLSGSAQPAAPEARPTPRPMLRGHDD